LEHQKRGVTQAWIYRNVIFPRFIISESCYKRYLAINAKNALHRLELERESEKKYCPTLF
jgi:hypothetical protein